MVDLLAVWSQLLELRIRNRGVAPRSRSVFGARHRQAQGERGTAKTAGCGERVVTSVRTQIAWQTRLAYLGHRPDSAPRTAYTASFSTEVS
eukprot:5318369-Prymnesium_polylepis.2